MRSSNVSAVVAWAVLWAAYTSAFSQVTIDSRPGFMVTWNGNDGDLQEVPDNLALAINGATAFSSGDLGPQLNISFHVADNVNDGLYGNTNSWIGGDGMPLPAHIGVAFGAARQFRAIAFGRDNTAANSDRSGGLYQIEITADELVGADSNWIAIASLNYGASLDPFRGGLFTASLRHEYQVATDAGGPITATGVRLLVPATGVGAGTGVDELEVLAAAISGPPPPPPPDVEVVAEPGFDMSWDGNEGDFFDPHPPPGGSLAPLNLATGARPFSSGDLGPQLALSYHHAHNINDGYYGNSNSWIGGNGFAAPFHVGVAFGRRLAINQVAWGRDNGNGSVDGSIIGTDPCFGSCTTRAFGDYFVEITNDPTPGPASQWQPVGAVFHRRSNADGIGGEFTSHFRHAFDLSSNVASSAPLTDSMPISATALRIRVLVSGDAGLAIDELEVYGQEETETFLSDGFEAQIAFTSHPANIGGNSGEMIDLVALSGATCEGPDGDPGTLTSQPASPVELGDAAPETAVVGLYRIHCALGEAGIHSLWRSFTLCASQTPYVQPGECYSEPAAPNHTSRGR